MSYVDSSCRSLQCALTSGRWISKSIPRRATGGAGTVFRSNSASTRCPRGLAQASQLQWHTHQLNGVAVRLASREPCVHSQRDWPPVRRRYSCSTITALGHHHFADLVSAAQRSCPLLFAKRTGCCQNFRPLRPGPGPKRQESPLSLQHTRKLRRAARFELECRSVREFPPCLPLALRPPPKTATSEISATRRRLNPARFVNLLLRVL
jgi:hypothetical protein